MLLIRLCEKGILIFLFEKKISADRVLICLYLNAWLTELKHITTIYIRQLQNVFTALQISLDLRSKNQNVHINVNKT